MKLLIKMLLFVLVVLIANVKVMSATITFPNIQEKATSFSFHNEISKTTFKIIENELENFCQNGNDLVDYRDWVISVIGNAAKGGATGFRYMPQAELKAIQETGYLRGGISGETYFTKDLYKSAASAQSRLSLGSSPALRVEFEILNNPTLLRNGTKVLPANGMIGRGAEFMTLDPVKVRLINWQSLR